MISKPPNRKTFRLYSFTMRCRSEAEAERWAKTLAYTEGCTGRLEDDDATPEFSWGFQAYLAWPERRDQIEMMKAMGLPLHELRGQELIDAINDSFTRLVL